MNIAFDAVAIMGLSRNRGIGYHFRQFIKNMILNDGNNQYFLFNCIEPVDLFNENIENYKESYFYLGKDSLLSSNSKFVDLYGELIKRFIIKNDIDIFIISDPFNSGKLKELPLGGYLPIYIKEWFENTNVVIMQYDLIPLIFKEQFLSDINIKKWYFECLEQLGWSKHIFTNSQATSDDLVKYLNLPQEKSTCLWCGAKEGVYKIDITDGDWKYIRKKYNIKKGFIMAPLAADFHKNPEELLRAYSKLKLDIRKNHQLVYTFNVSAEYKNKLLNLAKQYGCADTFIATGFVSDEDMLKMYNMSSLVAYPSKYEGFGMPIIEGFSCGTPVLTSNNSSCVQVAGNAAYLVDPFSIEDISRGLEEALTSNNTEIMIENGFERVKKFQWNVIAEQAVTALTKIPLKNIKSNQIMNHDKIINDSLLRKIRRRIKNKNYSRTEIVLLSKTLAYIDSDD